MLAVCSATMTRFCVELPPWMRPKHGHAWVGNHRNAQFARAYKPVPICAVAHPVVEQANHVENPTGEERRAKRVMHRVLVGGD